MVRDQRWLWVVGAVGLLFAGGWEAKHWLDRPRPSGHPVVEHTAAEVRLLLVKKSIRCGHSTVLSVTIPEEQLKNIGRLYKGWVIDGDDRNTLVMTKEEEGLCSICQTQQFFGIYQDKVAVFYGKPDRRGPVKEVTSIPISRLPRQEKQDLGQGIVFHNSKEKLQLLEGLSSLQE